ncbi:hypothetical protein HBB16_12545 [Pseudonocardia sp. MCCB 268]|nr:hypothetical protein [Pseudonocardia cytotoxica]
MERPELTEDPQFPPVPVRETTTSGWCRSWRQSSRRSRCTKWEEVLTEYDVPFAPVLTMSGYVDHPEPSGCCSSRDRAGCSCCARRGGSTARPDRNRRPRELRGAPARSPARSTTPPGSARLVSAGILNADG